MDTPKSPCLTNGPDGGKCRHFNNCRNQEPCKSCISSGIPAQYDDELKKTLFPTMAFMRDSSQFKNTKGKVKMEENKDTTSHGPGQHFPDDIKALENKSTHESGSKEAPDPTDPIEAYIQTVCESCGMMAERLRAGFKPGMDLNQRMALHKVRDRIIQRLASGHFGKLTQKQIGRYLNVKHFTISDRMRAMGINPRKNQKKKQSEKISSDAGEDDARIYKGLYPGKAIEFEDVMSQDDYPKIELDFTKYPGGTEIYQKICQAATDRLRSPKNQVMWWLINCDFEKLQTV